MLFSSHDGVVFGGCLFGKAEQGADGEELKDAFSVAAVNVPLRRIAAAGDGVISTVADVISGRQTVKVQHGQCLLSR